MNLYDLICTAQEDNYDALEEIIKREQKNIYASFCYLGAKKENISDFPSVLDVVNVEGAFEEDNNNVNNGYPLLKMNS